MCRDILKWWRPYQLQMPNEKKKKTERGEGLSSFRYSLARRIWLQSRFGGDKHWMDLCRFGLDTRMMWNWERRWLPRSARKRVSKIRCSNTLVHAAHRRDHPGQPAAAKKRQRTRLQDHSCTRPPTVDGPRTKRRKYNCGRRHKETTLRPAYFYWSGNVQHVRES